MPQLAVPDLTYDEGAPQDGRDGSTPADGSSSGSLDGASPTDGATPLDGGAPTCTLTPEQMQTDANNCGRCGHDCLGGACSAGTCASVIVATGLACPVGLVTDAENVYVATRGDGSVRRIAKLDGQVTSMSTGQKETRGLAIGPSTDGTTRLFWSNLNLAGDGGDAYSYGGVYGCTLPSCSDKYLVTLASYPAHLALSGEELYFAETNTFRVARRGERRRSDDGRGAGDETVERRDGRHGGLLPGARGRLPRPAGRRQSDEARLDGSQWDHCVRRARRRPGVLDVVR